MPGDRGSAFVLTSPEAAAALADGGAVVALESTILCHGMPWPRNLETARQMGSAIRERGAVPALIAVVDGTPRAGLDDDETERLARGGPAVTKASRRDLPFLAASGSDGATTVAATMAIAARAGIGVFATGGIGGVHRGVESTMDVSADLHELARTPVAVICSGAKSILDLPRTLEYLETLGVPVTGYRTNTLPAFYAADSGLALDYRVDSPAEAARAIRAQRDLGFGGGMVIAQPAPPEHALPAAEIDAIVEEALAELKARNVTGKATTPFLLARVADRTGGRSLESNVALAVANAALAADIAVALAELDRGAAQCRE